MKIDEMTVTQNESTDISNQLISDAGSHAKQIVSLLDKVISKDTKINDGRRGGMTATTRMLLRMNKINGPCRFKEMRGNESTVGSVARNLKIAGIIEQNGYGLYKLAPDWYEKSQMVLTRTQAELLSESLFKDEKGENTIDLNDRDAVRKCKAEKRLEFLKICIKDMESKKAILETNIENMKHEVAVLSDSEKWPKGLQIAAPGRTSHKRFNVEQLGD